MRGDIHEFDHGPSFCETCIFLRSRDAWCTILEIVVPYDLAEKRTPRPKDCRMYEEK